MELARLPQHPQASFLISVEPDDVQQFTKRWRDHGNQQKKNTKTEIGPGVDEGIDLVLKELGIGIVVQHVRWRRRRYPRGRGGIIRVVRGLEIR